MAEDEPQQAPLRRETGQAEEERGGLGYDDLSMNVVPASATEERSEAGRRARGLGGLVLVVSAAAAIIVVGTRLIANAPPGREAQERLRARLQGLPAWQLGTVMGAEYLAGNRLRVDFSPRLSPAKEKEREMIRQAAREVMGALMQERPGRDLYLDGYQGERQMVRGELRHKSFLVGPEGQQTPDILVRVEGDPEGGLAEAYGRSAGATKGR